MENMFINKQITANIDTSKQREEWRIFVNGNREIIQKVFHQYNIKKGGRALLLGAGNGNDIDILLMEELFDEIVLVDIDEYALDRFLLKTKNKSKFKKVVLDLSGVGAKAQNISNMTEQDRITYLNNLQSDLDFPDFPSDFDFVMNCNYTTQLISPFFMSQLNTRISSEAIAAINLCAERVITKIFKEIFKILKPGGVLIHSTDAIEYKHDKIRGSLNPAGQIINETTHGKIFDLHNHPQVMSEIMARGLGISGSTVPKIAFEKFIKTPHIFFNYWPFTNTPEELRVYVVCIYVFVN
ncbi:hypothetical protein [Paenibacillus sp. Leaf72]|uniref:hypothetical protein n=1 Tax=Paenibacillus sp. Leaf72 TaxID=1736234 RepID=UPI0006F92D45|nr:hypothetical protein [Paenibacillus sp. Leaf72]KQN96781.1 hypothetical protein ASF12_22170 [Paenibacillus sp. Leaf72]